MINYAQPLALLDRLVKSYIHGHYRRSKTGKVVWVNPFNDKRGGAPDGRQSSFDFDAEPKPAPKPEYVSQKTTKDVEKYVVDNKLANMADFGNVHADIANEMTKSLFEHIRDFPGLRRNQKFIGSGQNQMQLIYDENVNISYAWFKDKHKNENDDVPRRLALESVGKKPSVPFSIMFSNTHYKYGGIAFNESNRGSENKKHSRNPEGLKSLLAELKNNNYFSTSTIKGMADHEFGHQLDYLLKLQEDKEVIKLFSNAIKDGIVKEVSEYSGKNIGEFIAECWAEYRNSTNPRRYPVAIGKLIETRYAERMSNLSKALHNANIDFGIITSGYCLDKDEQAYFDKYIAGHPPRANYPDMVKSLPILFFKTSRL